jgi:hypothetical protein
LTCTLACTLAVPCSAGQTARHGERALRILDEIIRVLDRMLAGPPRSASDGEGWISLFDGRTLGSWKRTEFSGGGDVRVDTNFRGAPAIVVVPGASLSGITFTGQIPTTDYEIAVEFMKIEGSDFACGLTFPVRDSHATLVLGGWGGSTVGISSIDGLDASENETTTWISFPEGTWFRVRLKVTAKRLQAWLDDRQIVDVDIENRRISLRHGEISRSRPLGIATYQTRAAFRSIRLRRW